MSEMIERVAKAIEQASQPPGRKDYKMLMENCARAAIEAMRESTDEMRAAGEKADFSKFEGDHAPDDVWHAMIDEALK